MYVFFLREKSDTLACVPVSVQKMAHTQTICHDRKDKNVENSQEDTSKGDHASNYRLKPTRQ